MHGIVHAELQKYVMARHGRMTWQELLKQANLAGKSYLVSQHYPDSDVLALVTTASRMTGTPVPQLLEDFGEFIAPNLVNMYRPLLDARWRTLDLLEHTETTIHSVVRMRNPGASPPELRCRRMSESEVQVSYNSARKMCALARGIIRGLARHYGDNLHIEESACMHRGASSCEISVRQVVQRSKERPASGRSAPEARPARAPRYPG